MSMSEAWVITAACAYLLFLFGIAWWGDRQGRLGKRWVNNPWIYSLSLAVYCTAWTFFGSVGEASHSGMGFLAIYIGPSLAIPIAWIIWRRIIRICRAQGISSFAEFLSERYGRSSRVGVLVTLFMVMGVIPYISIQHKAISESFEVLTQWNSGDFGRPENIFTDSAFYFALLLTLFTLVFGTRRLESTDRNVGLVIAIASESIVKLLAFLLVGGFVAFVSFDGLGDIFRQAMADPELERLLHVDQGPGYQNWLFLVLLSMGAFLFLPRQFQVGVIENSQPAHLKKAMWIFPLYLLLINFFVLPLAIGGNLRFPGGEIAGDTYMMAIPLQDGAPGVALLAFLGGFAASTGMIIVSAIALGLALSNNIFMPLTVRSRPFLGRSGGLGDLAKYSRRISIAVIILLGYLFYRLVAAPYSLVFIGQISFVAVAQFAPATIGAVLWKKGNRVGAVAGLIAGFGIWSYTLILPTLTETGLVPESFVADGPFGIAALRPTALFGMQSFDFIAHGTFWSLLFNVALYIGLSYSRQQGSVERNQAEVFVDIFEYGDFYESSIARRGIARIVDIRSLLLKFHSEPYVDRALDVFGRKYDINWEQYREADARLINFTERLLTGIVGATSARVLVARVAQEEKVSMEDVFSILKESQALIASNRELQQTSEELRRTSEALQSANEQLKQQDFIKDEFLYTVTHELRTPLTSILALSELLMDHEEMEEPDRTRFLTTIMEESERMGRLINQVLDLEKYESGKQKLDMSQVDLVGLVEASVFEIRPQAAAAGIEVIVDMQRSAPPVNGDPDRLRQVLLNLLGNAVKFAAPPEGRIEVSLYFIDGAIKVNVVDNGDGIPENELESIFDKFYQVRSGARQRKSGSGLGLAISKQIVELHHGEMWAESELGKGAKFSFLIPVYQRIPLLHEKKPESADRR